MKLLQKCLILLLLLQLQSISNLAENPKIPWLESVKSFNEEKISPSHVLIENHAGQILCSGTLIALNFVLTVAFCVDNFTANELLVVTAHKTPHSNMPPPKIVAKKTTHPRYDNITLENNLVILKLNNYFTRRETVQVADFGLKNASSCSVNLWKDRTIQDFLTLIKMYPKKINLSYIPQCNGTAFHRTKFNRENQFCLQTHEKNSDMCQPDVGSGLMCGKSVEAILINGGCNHNGTFLFQNLARMKDWIKDSMKIQNTISLRHDGPGDEALTDEFDEINDINRTINSLPDNFPDYKLIYARKCGNGNAINDASQSLLMSLTTFLLAFLFSIN